MPHTPDTYSELYPGRFLKSDLFKGQKITLTLKNVVVEELQGEKGKEPKVVVSFTERPLDYVMPKTCGQCLKKMFGNNPREWVGKRVTWFPTTTRFGPDTVDCIRVWGSPDIPKDIHFSIPQGRKKPLAWTLHAVKIGECGWTQKRADAARFVPPVAAEPVAPEPEELEQPAADEHGAPAYDFGGFDDLVGDNLEAEPA